MAYLMGIDIGGTMVKAAIYDMDGNEIAVHGEKLHISYPIAVKTNVTCTK